MGYALSLPTRALIAALAILTLACGLLLLQTTDLSIVDLGRHIKNGESVLSGRTEVLHRNFYSFAQGDFPFINHHWLSGVVFYALWRSFGFGSLTLLYAALVTAAVLVMFFAAYRSAGIVIAAPLAALAIPLIAWRTDVRPESFTYFLIALTYLLLSEWHSGRLNPRWLYALPAILLLWVNLHIGFVFGFLLIGMFALKGPLKPLLIPAVLSVAAAAVNPSFIRGLLYPLNIFRNYGYDIAENQSIAAQAQRGLGGAPEYQLFWSLLALAAAAFILRWFKARPKSPSRLPELLLLSAVGVLAILQVRNLPVFALFAIPLVAVTLHDVVSDAQTRPLRLLGGAVFAAGLLFAYNQFGNKPNFGLGIRPGVNATAAFLKAHNVTGPVFNDFDIGGYLIFHGFQIFVDGRPEAYSEEFLKTSYAGALSDENTWRHIDGQYRFNAIVCSLQDAFPPIEHFLLTRAWDPAWAPVYTDPYTLVFVRRNDTNAELISKFAIPQNQFRRP